MTSLLLANLLMQAAPTGLGVLSDGPLSVGDRQYQSANTIINGNAPFVFVVDSPGYTDMNGQPLAVGARVLVTAVTLTAVDGSVQTCILAIPQ